MIEKLLEIADDLEHYAEHGEEYPDAEMLIAWAKWIRRVIEKHEKQKTKEENRGEDVGQEHP